MTPDNKDIENVEGQLWESVEGEIPAEDAVVEQARECGYNYTVRANDTVYLLGERFRIPWQAIAEANGLRPPYTLRIGQVLVIPVEVHRVARGESLWTISQLYNVTWQSIAAANNISYPYTIYPGQMLAIPGRRCGVTPPPPPPPPPPPTRVPCGVLYVVRAGDTVSSVAGFFGVTTAAIISANNLQPPYTIFVNQELIIPVVPRFYRVRAGDTISALASRFGTTVEAIARVNGLRPPYTIYEGQYIWIVSPCPEMGGWMDDRMYYDYGDYGREPY